MIFMGNAEVMRRNDERRICELKFSWDWQLRLQDACPVPLNSNYSYSILNVIPDATKLNRTWTHQQIRGSISDVLIINMDIYEYLLYS